MESTSTQVVIGEGAVIFLSLAIFIVFLRGKDSYFES